MSSELASWATPDEILSPLGTLRAVDGVPTVETAALLHDHLFYVRAVEAFLATYRAVSADAVHRAAEAIGLGNGVGLLFSELMDSRSLFLTANCDTVYCWLSIDLTDGPVAVEVPP